MLKKILTRLKNKKVIASIVSAILMYLVNEGMLSIEMSDTINTIVNGLLSFGILIGVFGNPESHVKETSE